MKLSQLRAISYSYAAKERAKIQKELEEMGVLGYFSYSGYKTMKGFYNALLGKNALKVLGTVVDGIRADYEQCARQLKGMKATMKCSEKALEGMNNKYWSLKEMLDEAIDFKTQFKVCCGD